jgi:hypothetical protein
MSTIDLNGGDVSKPAFGPDGRRVAAGVYGTGTPFVVIQCISSFRAPVAGLLSERQGNKTRPLSETTMADMPIIKNIKREQTVYELKPWKSIHDTIKKPMVTGLGPAEIPESALGMGFAHITEPDILGSPTHTHPFDQWIYLLGAENFSELDADIEFTFGEEILKINYPCYIFVPKGTKHCPLNIKRVGKPLIFIDASITQEASVRPEKIASVERPIYQALKNKK